LELPIEPKWNWNFVEIFSSFKLSASNRTKVELKRGKRYCQVNAWQPSNRTKVELKHWAANALLWQKRTSNRTKVELKQLLHGCFEFCPFLPIEPKWNWNMLMTMPGKEQRPFQSNQSGIETFGVSLIIANPAASNRTKVELKLYRKVKLTNDLFFQSNQSGIETSAGILTSSKALTSNRTKVELKHKTLYSTCLHLHSSNRTKVELKHCSPCTCRKLLTTSNRTKVELKPVIAILPTIPAFFQSNQSGIETSEAFWARSWQYFFQSNQSGIETMSLAFGQPALTLPIEPKWNWNKY